MSSQSLDEVVRSQCVQLLDHILDGSEITIAVVADRKGNLLVAPSRECGVDTLRVAEVAAKVIELGNALAKVQSPSLKDVAICDLKGSPMVVLPAGDALLCVVGGNKSNMGLVVGIARDACRNLADKIAKAKTNGGAATQQAKTDRKVEVPPQQVVENGFVFDADGFTARVLEAIEERNLSQQAGGLLEGL